MPDYTIGYNAAAKKYLERSQQKVKDVCIKCNGGILSDLDAYAKKFIETNKLEDLKVTKSRSIIVNPKLLIRWVLKVVSNASRATGNNEDFLRRYTSLIIQGKPPSHFNKIRLFAELIKPHIFTEEERTHLQEPYTNEIEVLPMANRVSRMEGSLPDNVVGRMVSINALYIYLVMWNKHASSETVNAAVDSLSRSMGSLTEIIFDLKTEESVVKLKTPRRDALQAYMHQHLYTMDEFEKWASDSR